MILASDASFAPNTRVGCAVRRPRNDLTAEYVRSILDYDSETGVFRWRWRADRDAQLNARDAGRIAGALNSHGYRHIKIDDRLYKAHRLAWLHVTGAWPRDQIDHINGVRDDNRLANLREATRAENNRNYKRRVSNTSGFKGVSWHKQARKWRAQIWMGGRRRHLGYFATAEEAHAAYCAAARELHGDFANTGTHKYSRDAT